MPVCPNPGCDVECDALSTHWWRSKDCDYPTPTEYQQQLFRGMLLGDGSVVQKDGKNPQFSVEMDNGRFLEWLHDQLKPLTQGVRLYDSNRADVRTKKLQATGFASGECSDIYRLDSRTLPWLANLRSWYDSGEKRFPDDYELTPLEAKMWYVSDGGVTWGNYGQVSIASVNESDRQEFLIDLFGEAGFEMFATGKKVVVTQADRDALLEWMGPAPPGFEYKWEAEDRDRYYRLQ